MIQRGALSSGRIIWALAMLTLIACVCGLELDRQSRADPRVALWVPSIFRGYAEEVLSIKAYRDGDVRAGLWHAERMVRRRPVPAEGLSLMARGYVSEQNSNKAIAALTLAAARGWRDLYVQSLLANVALSQGDKVTAAQRLVAFWRLNQRDDQTYALTDALLKQEGGVDAFLNVTQSSDRWLSGVLEWGLRQNLPASTNERIAQAFARKHIEPNCDIISTANFGYAQAGNADAAVRVWGLVCAGSNPVTRPDDFAFRQEPGVLGPFDWIFPDQAGLTTELVKSAGRVRVDFTNNDYVHSKLASRTMALKPGHHTVSMEGYIDSANHSVLIQLTCFSIEAKNAEQTRFWLGSRESGSFEVPANGCSGQRLEVLVGRGRGHVERISVH